MARSINYHKVLEILVKEKFIKENQLSSIKSALKKTGFDLINFVINQNIIDNELMIDILHKGNIIASFDNDKKVIIDDYSKSDEYIKNGYFIYRDDSNNKIIAINDLKNLHSLMLESEIIQIIKKKDFYRLFEKNFAHLNVIKSKYFLDFITNKLSARNVNYTQKFLVFFSIFLCILIYFPPFFHVINSFCYLLQNSLKALLFARAVFPQKK